MKDFLIVGAGLAGISFAEIAFQEEKSFMVFNNDSQNSSKVAAGLYNPVVLKRFSLPQDADKHLSLMRPFYEKISQRLDVEFDHKLPILRKFSSVEEQNNWFQAADKPVLEKFLCTDIVADNINCLPAPFGFGKVNQTGYIDTGVLISAYHTFLNEIDSLRTESFEYNSLEIYEDYISYHGIVAKHIVFAEGFGIHSNPFFNYLPLDGTKGELLIIKAPDLCLEVAVNASIFILPLGKDIYKVGATYEWYDKTAIPTAAGKEELAEKLNELINCDYEVIDHQAGIRPTVKDRKPLIGTHPVHKRLHLLNGLGTRGVMLGPSMANELYESIITGTTVRKDIGLHRFRYV